MDLGLRDKVAVVTGGTFGIGLATARLLLDEGAFVAICGRNQARLAAAKSSLPKASLPGNAAPERLLALQCDVLDKEAVGRFAAAVGQWHGRCDILINNAGQARLSTFSDTTDEAWREELELKFFSQIHPVRAFKPLLDKSDAAAILAVNSLLAYQPEPYMVATAAARAGAQNLVKSLAREFAPRIRVNSVMLGLIESGQWERRFAARKDPAQTRQDWYAEIARTRHIPMERLGTPDEVARAIAFLCSPAAGFITGAQLEISGGISRHM
jgi:NAD(P)-dependent dehydrogenase (short-subunit alcohol dehydrogenase family)